MEDTHRCCCRPWFGIGLGLNNGGVQILVLGGGPDESRVDALNSNRTIDIRRLRDEIAANLNNFLCTHQQILNSQYPIKLP